MHYIIHCLDHEGQVQRRLDHYEAHKAIWRPSRSTR